MEQIWIQAMERLSNPEVLFGLAVRFFGVFIVLIIVMIVLYLSGLVFQRLEEKAKAAPSPSGPARASRESTPGATPTGDGGTSPGSAVPDEVAAAVALAMVPDEIAVAVALALKEASKEEGPARRPFAPAGAAAEWQEPGSAWKFMGRHQALCRKTSLTRDITSKGDSSTGRKEP